MSWFEYSDMFDNAQIKGKYKCFVFDMKNSKHGYDIQQVLNFVELFKTKINPKVIHKLPKKDNPFLILGDLIVLVINKNEISDNYIYESFKTSKNKIGLNKEYHYFSGYYETDNWEEGSELYYLGYCIQELEHRAKQRKDLL